MRRHGHSMNHGDLRREGLQLRLDGGDVVGHVLDDRKHRLQNELHIRLRDLLARLPPCRLKVHPLDENVIVDASGAGHDDVAHVVRSSMDVDVAKPTLYWRRRVRDSALELQVSKVGIPKPPGISNLQGVLTMK